MLPVPLSTGGSIGGSIGGITTSELLDRPISVIAACVKLATAAFKLSISAAWAALTPCSATRLAFRLSTLLLAVWSSAYN